MNIDPATIVTKVILKNMQSGFETVLFERQDSKCHFHKEFEHGKYIIQLRLDWNDIVNGDPTLDLDIWEKPKSKKTKLEKGKWHQADKNYDKAYNRKIYTLVFEDLKLIIGSEISIAKCICTDIRWKN